MSPFARSAVVLGLLAAVGPFAIDMYLPALPAIRDDLGTTTGATQMTLMAFFIAFGLCQLVYGPVADMAGRKLPLYAGLGLFLLGSVGCALAPNVEWLIGWRIVQGIGAASVMVVPRAIVRDLYTGIEATRMMGLVMLVLSVSPILAPFIGSQIIIPFGWRAVFVAVSVIAALAILLLFWFLPETHPPAARIRVSVSALGRSMAGLLRHRQFMGLTFVGGFGMASFFAFLANSPFVYMTHYGLSEEQYGIAFGVNAISFIGASQLASRLGARFGMTRMVMTAIAFYAASAVAMFVVFAAGVDSLTVLIVMMFLTNAWLGLVIPTSMVLALEEHGPVAGIASALGGTLQMLLGGIVMAIASLFGQASALPMVSAIAVCAVLAFVLSQLTLRVPRALAQPAE